MSSMRIRRGCICFGILASALLFVGAAPPPKKSPPPWFWGCWVVTKWLPVKDISALSQKQVDAMIGTRLVFAPTCARSGREVLKSPVYSARVVSDEDFFRLGSYVNLRDIGVHAKQVTEVEVDLPDNLSDLDFPGTYMFLREKDIVIEVEGDYFVAKRAKPGDPACTCEISAPK